MNRKRKICEEKKVSIIVGGMYGIGKNTSRIFCEDGNYVIILDKRKPTKNEDKKHYHQNIQLDLTEKESLENSIRKIYHLIPKLSHLIFSVKYRGNPKNSWDGEIQIGMNSIRSLIDKLTPLMEGNDASIVLVSSTAARLFTYNCTMAYHIVKAAMEQMIRYYAVKLGPKKIRVNGIAPGYLVKDESIDFFKKNKDMEEKARNIHPLQRYGSSDDAAKVIRFLCSEDASFITGQTITVDGGLSLFNPGFGKIEDIYSSKESSLNEISS